VRIDCARSATTSVSSTSGAPSFVSGYRRTLDSAILSGAAGKTVSVLSFALASRQSGVRCAIMVLPK